MPQRTAQGNDLAPAIEVAGASFVPDRSGALWWPAAEALIVADLHLEKGSAFAARKRGLLPPYDTAATLSTLGTAIARYRPRTIIALGDSFHDVEAGERLAETDMKTLRALQHDRRWIWITGNHDPDIPPAITGERHATLRLGPITFRHEPSHDDAHGEIAGHLHPCAKIASGGRRFRRRCFIHDTRRLILPAFGAYTGGLNVLDCAFQPLFDGTQTVLAIGDTAIYRLALRRLVPDGRAKPLYS